MKTNSLVKKIIGAAIIVLILGGLGYFGYSAFKTHQMEKKFEARVNQGVELYNRIKDANKIIDQHHQAYIKAMSEAVEKGTFSEDAETQAFNTMYEAIDREIKAFNLYTRCDSLNSMQLSEYDFTPEYKDKIEELETLMTKLNNCGYAVAGFSTRSDKWKNDPWYSMNTPTYHSFKQIASNANELDVLGEELNKFSPGSHQSTKKSSNVNNIVEQAINYYNGKGVQQNISQAFGLFTEAAEQGHAHSMYNLGYILEDTDKASADKWYKKAAIAGDTDAMIQLAQRYYKLLPTYQNISDEQAALAKKWYNRAANYGNTTGLYYIGLYYMNEWGNANNADKSKAEKYFQIGSICGDAHCTYMYGVLQPTTEKQAQCYRLALQQDPNHAPARENLRRLGY